MVTATEPRTFTSLVVCKLANVTYRQLDVWVHRSWLNPQLRYPEYCSATGNPRIWSEAEAIKACELGRMVRAGILPSVAGEYVLADLTATLTVIPLPETLRDPKEAAAGQPAQS